MAWKVQKGCINLNVKLSGVKAAPPHEAHFPQAAFKTMFYSFLITSIMCLLEVKHEGVCFDPHEKRKGRKKKIKIVPTVQKEKEEKKESATSG